MLNLYDEDGILTEVTSASGWAAFVSAIESGMPETKGAYPELRGFLTYGRSTNPLELWSELTRYSGKRTMSKEVEVIVSRIRGRIKNAKGKVAIAP